MLVADSDDVVDSVANDDAVDAVSDENVVDAVSDDDDAHTYAEANFSQAPICSLISPPLLAADARCSTEAPL